LTAFEGPALRTTSVYVRACPAITGSGLSDFVTDTSAEAFTIVVSVSLLFPSVGSDVAEVTDTLFVSVPLAPGLTVPVIVIVTWAPAASVANVQRLLVPLSGAGVADPKMNPAGYVSVTTTLAAFEGPALLTTSVYVRACPAITGSGLSDFVTDTSAEALTVVAWVAVLFPGVRSGVAEVTDTLFISVPLAPALTVPWIVIVTDPPAAIVPSAHTLFPVVGAGVADPKMNPAGYVSVTTTPWALDGPTFVTTSVYVSACPAITGSGESAFVIETSA
jgi:hypothetical protein